MVDLEVIENDSYLALSIEMNLTIDKLYEKVFLDLNAQDNTSDGLTKIWTDIKADTDEIYKIDFSDGESS